VEQARVRRDRDLEPRRRRRRADREAEPGERPVDLGAVWSDEARHHDLLRHARGVPNADVTSRTVARALSPPRQPFVTGASPPANGSSHARTAAQIASTPAATVDEPTPSTPLVSISRARGSGAPGSVQTPTTRTPVRSPPIVSPPPARSRS